MQGDFTTVWGTRRIVLYGFYMRVWQYFVSLKIIKERKYKNRRKNAMHNVDFFKQPYLLHKAATYPLLDKQLPLQLLGLG